MATVSTYISVSIVTTKSMNKSQALKRKYMSTGAISSNLSASKELSDKTKTDYLNMKVFKIGKIAFYNN